MARGVLGECFGPQIWVRGEIHGLKVHAKSGHMYFDLVEKPSGTTDAYIAKVSCAFFRGAFVKWHTSLKSLGLGNFELSSGLEIKLLAGVDLFVKEGRYQLIVSEIDPSYTFGAIAKKRARTIEQLRSSGLMDLNKDLAFPVFPLNIGLITSEGSAAYNDFMSIVMRSSYSFSIALYDAHMQGQNTVPEIISGIRVLQRHPGVDTIVIIRGGGAKTDLFSFDDLAICTAIARCPKPVITGIGHEIDISVADMVAHTYCVTPTDVARLFVSRADGLEDHLLEARQELSLSTERMLASAGQRLATLGTHLGHLCSRWTMTSLSRLKGLAYSLDKKITQHLSARHKDLERIAAQVRGLAATGIARQSRVLDRLHLQARHDSLSAVSSCSRDVDALASALKSACSKACEINRNLLDQRERVVTLMHPSETLKRGYSITINSKGLTVTDPGDVDMDEPITTIVQHGTIKSTVCDKEPG